MYSFDFNLRNNTIILCFDVKRNAPLYSSTSNSTDESFWPNIATIVRRIVRDRSMLNNLNVRSCALLIGERSDRTVGSVRTQLAAQGHRAVTPTTSFGARTTAFSLPRACHAPCLSRRARNATGERIVRGVVRIGGSGLERDELTSYRP